MLMSFETAKMKNGKSIITVVATVNTTFTSIFSKNAEFNNLDEKYLPMFTLYLQAIEFFHARNKSYPKEVIIMQNAVPRDQVVCIKEYFIEKVLAHNYQK